MYSIDNWILDPVQKLSQKYIPRNFDLMIAIWKLVSYQISGIIVYVRYYKFTYRTNEYGTSQIGSHF